MIIYTCIIGKYDNLKRIKNKNNNNKYVCITDSDLVSEDWEVLNVSNFNPPNLEGRLLQRWVKTIGGLNYFKEDCIYIDGSYEIINDLTHLFGNFKQDIVFKIHPHRTNVFDEILACIYRKKDNEDIITKQAIKYYNLGIKDDIGLYETGCYFRKYNTNTIRFCKLWFNEIKKYSIRDQISLPYILQKTNIEIGKITDNELRQYARLHKHLQ